MSYFQDFLEYGIQLIPRWRCWTTNQNWPNQNRKTVALPTIASVYECFMSGYLLLVSKSRCFPQRGHNAAWWMHADIGQNLNAGQISGKCAFWAKQRLKLRCSSIFDLFIIELTIYIILQEAGRGQQKTAKWGRRPMAGGFEIATVTSKIHDLIRLATAWLPLRNKNIDIRAERRKECIENPIHHVVLFAVNDAMLITYLPTTLCY